MYRWLEFCMALIMIVLLAPVIAVVGLLILICMGRPILFSQQRPGMHAQPFTVYKFRSMQRGEETDALRLTTLGKWLRKSSLDELPQLWNVLKGDIGFVGPRPLLMEYLPLYSKEQARRHLVRPGITGWAQINGRNAISWEERFKLDVWYVEHKSFWLDLKILFLTFFKVLQAKDICCKEQPTMYKFTGTKTEMSQ